MSILIKDMKMPKRCLECPFYDNYNYYCILYSFGIPARYNRDGSTRPEWCEIKELPERNGRWEVVKHRAVEHGDVVIDGDTVRCSVCRHAEKGWNIGMKYCPNCGARMVKEGEEHD